MPKKKSPAKVVASVPPANPATFHIDRRAAAILADAGNGGDDDLLTTAQAAEWLGVSQQWLETRRSRGGGPPFVRLSPRVVRYPRSETRSWLNQRAHARTADYKRKRAAKNKRSGEGRLNAT
jgi:predicted DNA-binding transcriptional regulator AlpA